MTSETSLRVNFMKFACAVMVVAVHCNWPWSETWSPTWFVRNVFSNGELTDIAVPFFFLCSGCFLAKHLGTFADWWSAVRKRVRTILVPYFIWVLIFFVLCPLVIGFVGDLIFNRPLWTGPLAFVRDFDLIHFFEVCTWRVPEVFWFLRCLFVFVLLSPLVAFMTRRFGWKWLALCFALGILHLWPNVHLMTRFFYNDFNLQGLFYFSLGIYLYHHPLYIPCRSGGGGAALIAVILAALRLFLLAHGFDVYAKMVCGVAIPFMMFAVWCVMPARRLPSWLDNMFFPIYLMHMCFIWSLKPVFRHVAFFADSPRTCAILNLLVGVFGSILAAHLLRRLFPLLSRLLFGDR